MTTPKIARGSLLELETQLILSKDLGFLDATKYNAISYLIEEESKMINSFIKSLSN